MTRSFSGQPRLVLAALLLAGASLAGCDALSGESDDVTGVWTGDVTFKADTLLTGPAVRIEYDMVERLELRLIHEDGLVRGTVTRDGEGTKIFRSATGIVDSSLVSDREPVSHNVYGTFLEDSDKLALEVLPRWRDHPICGTEEIPYSSGLLTFELSGRKGRSQAYILLSDGGIGSDGDPFTVSVRSDERLSIDRDASDEPGLATVINDPGQIYAACNDDGTGEGTLAPAPENAPVVSAE